MHKNFSFLFYLKKPKNYNGGSAPIYLRVTIEGKRTEISTQRQCAPEKWNSHSGRMVGVKEDVRALNVYLDTLLTKAYEAHREILVSGMPLTAESFKLKFIGEDEERPRMLMEIYEHHNKQFAELVGKEYSEGTLKKFKSCVASLRLFLHWKLKKEDVSIKSLGFEFITDYEFYLKSVQNIQHNTAMGYIKKLKKIIRQSVANNWLDKDPFMGYKIRIRETHRNFLTGEELQILCAKEFSIARLDHVKDIFLFSCFTGLAYADVMKLTAMDVATGIDGEQWIFTKRMKTDTLSRIPLLPIAIAIIGKYRDYSIKLGKGYLLPVLSNQRMNSYLKEITDACGFKKELTFHCARHTFATTVTLANGVPIETVSEMLGHSSLRTTQHYGKIVDRKISNDMSGLRKIFQIPNSIPKANTP